MLAGEASHELIALNDFAGLMTWPKTMRLFPLRGFALRLLRGLLGRGLRLPTFRHCALQLRDGAIE
jgi:hypothetical protein